jgi:ribonuclease HI
VYARADASGSLRADRGRVEIRYKPSDGRRYDARADNLEVIAGEAVLPDETCAAAEPVAKDAGGQAKGAGGAAIASARASGGAQASKSSKVHRESPLPAGSVVAYADGACSGNPGPAGLGVVLIDGARRVEISEYLGEGTNNIAELTAVLRAIEEVDDPGRTLVIRTDSQYTIGVLQKGWKAKANVDLIEELRDTLKGRSVQIQYVPGHSGVLLNERADALAREAVVNRKSRRAVVATGEKRPEPGDASG